MWGLFLGYQLCQIYAYHSYGEACPLHEREPFLSEDEGKKCGYDWNYCKENAGPGNAQLAYRIGP